MNQKLKVAFVTALAAITTVAFQLDASAWTKKTGLASTIAASKGGVHIGGRSGKRVYKWNGTTWIKTSFDETAKNPVVDIAAGKLGNPWIVAKDKSIHKIQKGKWASRPGKASRVAASRGGVWIVGQDGKRVYKWTPKKKAWSAPIYFSRDGKNLITDVAAGKLGNAWIVAQDKTIHKLSKGKWVAQPGKASRITASNGGVWIVGQDGKRVYKWDPKKKAWGAPIYFSRDGKNPIVDIGVTADGKVWICAKDQTIHVK